MKWTRPHRSRLASASRLTIRRHVPWPLRLLSLALAVALGAVAAWAGWHAWSGQGTGELSQARADALALRAQLDDLQDKLAVAQAERARLALIANSADSQVKVEQSASERLAAQLHALEAENGKLKADLAYLETLLPAPDVVGEGGVAIRRLVVEAGEAPGQVNYRALLALPGRAERDFNGSFQFVVATLVNGKPGSWNWPDPAAADASQRSRLAFRRFQRIEGSFDLPPGVTIRSVQLRVLERGTVRAQQSVTP